jgi:hypothetical protein
MAVKLEDLQNFYDALAEQSKPTDDGKLRYEGHTYKLFAAIEPKLPQPYYSKLRRYLLHMGCVTQVRRGARHAPSVWILHFRPDSDSLSQVDKSAVLSPPAEEQNARLAVNRQQLRDILSKLGDLNVKDILYNFEQRLQALEATTKELQAKHQIEKEQDN